jgi:hypothetical protein
MNDDAKHPPSPAPVGGELARDTNTGRFLAGNNGGGRRKGSRSRLGDTFLAKLADHFETHGAAALDKLAAEQPEAYLSIISRLIPKPGEPINLSELSGDELNEAYDIAKRNKQIRTIFESEGL